MTNPATYIDALVNLLKGDAAVTAIIDADEIKAYHDVVDADGDRSIDEYVRNMTAPAVLVAWERTGPAFRPADRFTHALAIYAVFETETQNLDFITAVFGLQKSGVSTPFYYSPGASIHESATHTTVPEFSRRGTPKDPSSFIDYLYASFQISERC